VRSSATRTNSPSESIYDLNELFNNQSKKTLNSNMINYNDELTSGSGLIKLPRIHLLNNINKSNILNNQQQQMDQSTIDSSIVIFLKIFKFYFIKNFIVFRSILF
jgi:hypothetical protein